MNPFAIATLQLDELFEFLKDDAVGVAFYLEENDEGQYLVAKKAFTDARNALCIEAKEQFPVERISVEYPKDDQGRSVTHFEFLQDRKIMGLAYFSIDQFRMMRQRGNRVVLYGGLVDLGGVDSAHKKYTGKFATLMAEVIDPVKLGPNDSYDPEAPAYEPLSFGFGVPCPPSWNNFGEG
jgi:hypothetical protein